MSASAPPLKKSINSSPSSNIAGREIGDHMEYLPPISLGNLIMLLLLKPISFERLLQAVNKYLGENVSVVSESKHEIVEEKNDYIFVRSDRKMIKINFSEIIFWLLEKEDQDSKTVYSIAINNFHSLKHYFTPELKEKFLSALQQIADSYPPATIEEF
mgnify:CR=1 FL=1